MNPFHCDARILTNEVLRNKITIIGTVNGKLYCQWVNVRKRRIVFPAAWKIALFGEHMSNVRNMK